MSKPIPKYLDDFDTGIDCGTPAAAVVIVWVTGVACVLATLITVAAVAALAGVR